MLLVAECGQKDQQEEAQADTDADAAAEVDAASTASVVDTVDGFIRAAGWDGTWIIATTREFSVDGDVYFQTVALRDSLEMDDASEVTGEIRIGIR